MPRPPRVVAVLSLCLGLAGTAAAFPAPIGGIATIELARGASLAPCDPAAVSLARTRRTAPQLLLCGTLITAAGIGVRYEFHRCGLLASPTHLDVPALTRAMQGGDGAGPRFAGWRVPPTWNAARRALLWAYDVDTGAGGRRTLAFVALCAREGVLTFQWTASSPAEYAAGERGFLELVSSVAVRPGRRWSDAVAGDARAASQVADLVPGRGVPPASGDARWRAAAPGAGAPPWVTLRGSPAPLRVAVATALAMLLAGLMWRALRRSPRLPEPTNTRTVEEDGDAIAGGGAAAARAAGLDPFGRRVLARIESLVRDLDDSELTIGASAEETIGVDLAVAHEAAFEVVETGGTGGLPGHVTRVGSLAELGAQLGRLRETCESEAGARIDAWVNRSAGDYRALLEPATCLGDRPVLGTQHSCSACSGRGHNVCSGCGGRGENSCIPCGGQGTCNCSNCGGQGNTSCTGCGGSGTRQESHSVSEWNSATNSHETRWEYRTVSCFSCGGRGRQSCGACSGGRVTCWGCHGTGRVRCGGCGGSGQVTCSSCAGTGVLHRIGRVTCRVDRGMRLAVRGGIDEDGETLRTRVPFESLGTLGDVRLAEARRSGRTVQLLYRSDVAVRALMVTAHGAPIGLRGYGPHGEIYDHHRMAEALLEPDLGELEARLKGLPWWKRVGSPELVDATRRLLGSELSAQVVEGADGVPRLVAANLAGDGFVRRLHTACDRAFGKLQGAAIEQRALAWFAGLALLGLGTRLLVFRGVADLPLHAGILVAAVVSWALLEIESHRRVRALLGAPLAKRAAPRLAAVRARHRWVALVLFVLAWALAMVPDLL